jgi:hypothetical protein
MTGSQKVSAAQTGEARDSISKERERERERARARAREIVRERERERERALFGITIYHNGESRAAPAHGLRITKESHLLTQSLSVSKKRPGTQAGRALDKE